MPRFKSNPKHIKNIFVLCAINFLIADSSITMAASVKSLRRPSAEAHLSYGEAGNPGGIPVVLIHAFPLNRSMWDGQVESLKKSARVITFDIRGLGGSVLKSPYTLEFVVDDLIQLLDQLKIDKAVVCGLSMGGFVALRAVERNPERFLGAIFADTKSEADSDKSRLGRYKALKTIQEQGLSVFAEGLIKTALAPSTLTDKPQIFERAKSIAGANSPAGVSAAVLALTSRTDTTDGLVEIRIPTMILQGEMDTVISLEAAKSLHERIKGSTFFIIPKAGHLSNLENPEAFNAHLDDFITRLKP